MAGLDQQQPPGPTRSPGRGWNEYTQLSRQLRQAGLLERRRGWYAARIGLEPGPARRRAGWPSSCGRVLVAAARRRLPGVRLHPARLHRPRRRPPADLPHPARQRPGRSGRMATCDRVQLWLVGRQAQPPPRQPQPRGARPRHRHRRAGLHRRPGPRQAGPDPVDRPRTRRTCSSRCCCWRPATCTWPASRPSSARRGQANAGEARLLLVHCRRLPHRRVAGPVAAAGVAFVVVQQGLFGLYLGCRSRPTTRACRSSTADDELDFLRRQVLTSRNVRGSRLRRLPPRRTQLPDRAPPVPEHAPAQPAPCPAAGPGVLPPARHPLCRGDAVRLLRRGPAPPPRGRGAPAPAVPE